MEIICILHEISIKNCIEFTKITLSICLKFIDLDMHSIFFRCTIFFTTHFLCLFRNPLQWISLNYLTTGIFTRHLQFFQLISLVQMIVGIQTLAKGNLIKLFRKVSITNYFGRTNKPMCHSYSVAVQLFVICRHIQNALTHT